MRGKRAKKRKIDPDPVYSDLTLSKFINYMMQDGKKSTARKIVYGALDIASKEMKMDQLDVFKKAVDTVKPKMEVRSRRVGGANYQVPVPVSAERQDSLAMKWIISAARSSRTKTSLATQLARELIGSINKESAAFKKREETHKMAEANKAFAHFQW